MEKNHYKNIPFTEINEILGKPPSWIVRWGNTLLLLIFLVFLTISWIIQYPDVIETTFVLQSKTNTTEIIANYSGHIEEIFVADNTPVKSGDVIGIIKNTADIESISELELRINDFTNGKGFALPNQSLKLGDLQPYYSTFLQTLKENNFLVNSKFNHDNKTQYQNQINNLQKSIDELQNIESVALKELGLIKKQFLDKQSLYSSGVIDRFELESYKSKEYEKEKEINQLKLNIIDKNKEINQLKSQIVQLNQTNETSKNAQSIQLLEDANLLKSKISEWKFKYLLIAQSNGILSYAQNRQKGQYVQEKEVVFNILPQNQNNDPDSINVSVYLPQVGSGKVEVGQKCQLKLDAYPSTEFGFLEGVIKSKSLVPKDNKYYIEISLLNGMVTSYNKKIEKSQQMTGTALIITDKKRLLKRIIEKIIGKFTK